MLLCTLNFRILLSRTKNVLLIDLKTVLSGAFSFTVDINVRPTRWFALVILIVSNERPFCYSTVSFSLKGSSVSNGRPYVFSWDSFLLGSFVSYGRPFCYSIDSFYYFILFYFFGRYYSWTSKPIYMKFSGLREHYKILMI